MINDYNCNILIRILKIPMISTIENLKFAENYQKLMKRQVRDFFGSSKRMPKFFPFIIRRRVFFY